MTLGKFLRSKPQGVRSRRMAFAKTLPKSSGRMSNSAMHTVFSVYTGQNSGLTKTCHSGQRPY